MAGKKICYWVAILLLISALLAQTHGFATPRKPEVVEKHPAPREPVATKHSALLMEAQPAKPQKQAEAVRGADQPVVLAGEYNIPDLPIPLFAIPSLSEPAFLGFLFPYHIVGFVKEDNISCFFPLTSYEKKTAKHRLLVLGAPETGDGWGLGAFGELKPNSTDQYYWYFSIIHFEGGSPSGFVPYFQDNTPLPYLLFGLSWRLIFAGGRYLLLFVSENKTPMNVVAVEFFPENRSWGREVVLLNSSGLIEAHEDLIYLSPFTIGGELYVVAGFENDTILVSVADSSTLTVEATYRFTWNSYLRYGKKLGDKLLLLGGGALLLDPETGSTIPILDGEWDVLDVPDPTCDGDLIVGVRGEFSDGSLDNLSVVEINIEGDSTWETVFMWNTTGNYTFEGYGFPLLVSGEPPLISVGFGEEVFFFSLNQSGIIDNVYQFHLLNYSGEANLWITPVPWEGKVYVLVADSIIFGSDPHIGRLFVFEANTRTLLAEGFGGVWSRGIHSGNYTDSDGDGLLDVFEAHFGSSTQSTDTDGDGVEDGLELLWCGDPTLILEVIPEGGSFVAPQRVVVRGEVWLSQSSAITVSVGGSTVASASPSTANPHLIWEYTLTANRTGSVVVRYFRSGSLVAQHEIHIVDPLDIAPFIKLGSLLSGEEFDVGWDTHLVWARIVVGGVTVFDGSGGGTLTIPQLGDGEYSIVVELWTQNDHKTSVWSVWVSSGNPSAVSLQNNTAVVRGVNDVVSLVRSLPEDAEWSVVVEKDRKIVWGRTIGGRSFTLPNLTEGEYTLRSRVVVGEREYTSTVRFLYFPEEPEVMIQCSVEGSNITINIVVDPFISGELEVLVDGYGVWSGEVSKNKTTVLVSGLADGYHNITAVYRAGEWESSGSVAVLVDAEPPEIRAVGSIYNSSRTTNSTVEFLVLDEYSNTSAVASGVGVEGWEYSGGVLRVWIDTSAVEVIIRATAWDSHNNTASLTLILYPDMDGDGLTNQQEAVVGTDPSSPDTDGDGLSDYEETVSGLNPLSRDTDGDGFPDSSDPDPKTNNTLPPLTGFLLSLAIYIAYHRKAKKSRVEVEGGALL